MPNSTQEQAERRVALQKLLRHGPATTQRILGAIKTPAGYELPGSDATDAEQMAGIATLLRDINPAGPNLLVIRTAVGAAQRVALALDRCNWPEMIGNIGGDDTVFVATASALQQKNLVARIERSARP